MIYHWSPRISMILPPRLILMNKSNHVLRKTLYTVPLSVVKMFSIIQYCKCNVQDMRCITLLGTFPWIRVFEPVEKGLGYSGVRCRSMLLQRPDWLKRNKRHSLEVQDTLLWLGIC
jgi:hypothetical protein